MSPTIVVVLLSLVGTSLAAGLPYVIAGDQVDRIEDWPWQGSVHGNGGFVCGCTLITSEWAVTAAGCARSPPYVVRFGSIKRREGISKAVSEIIIHEKSSGLSNDIALLKFSPLELSDKIKPITLGETEEKGNRNCYITGWGLVNSSDTSYPEVLHQGGVTPIGNTVCAWDWSNIKDSQVCTQWSSGRPTTCRGDRGGPLVCKRDGEYQLVGISSFQKAGCPTHYYPVFTRVSYFKLWILGKIQ